jgi:hypothetical protein
MSRTPSYRVSSFGNLTLYHPVSNGQNKGRTRIADSCIAENGLEKLATIPARITEPP